MKKEHIIGITAVVLLAALLMSCSKSSTVTAPAITLNTDHGTSATTLTNNGYTLVVGKTTIDTNAVGLSPKQ